MSWNLKQSFEDRAKRLGISRVLNDEQQVYFSKFRNLQFWLWDVEGHQNAHSATGGNCCFNHSIGLPRKNGKAHPIYAYQYEIINALKQHKLIAITKARGVGVSELVLRWMFHLCVRDNAMRGKNIAIITGIREDLSLELLRRFRNLLPNYPWEEVDGNTSNTVVLNGCRITGYPSKRTKDLRGAVDQKFVFIDEVDFFDESDAQQVLSIAEALRVKSDPTILIASSPGRLGGLLHSLYQEPEATCRYKRLFIPYSSALGTLFTEEEIEEAKRQPGFEREFNLKWGYGDAGNLFSPLDIQKAIDLGKTVKEPYQVIQSAPQYIGCDPGAADSAFSITMTQMYNRRVFVCYQENFHRPDEDDMIERIMTLLAAADFKANVFVDAANQSFIKRLKQRVHHNEVSDWEWHQNYLKQNKVPDSEWVNHMIVVPVSFNVHGPRLLQTLHAYVQRNLIGIPPDFTELIQSLQSARLQERASHEWALSKESYSHDALDSLRLTMYDFIVTQEKKNKQR